MPKKKIKTHRRSNGVIGIFFNLFHGNETGLKNGQFDLTTVFIRREI